MYSMRHDKNASTTKNKIVQCNAKSQEGMCVIGIGIAAEDLEGKEKSRSMRGKEGRGVASNLSMTQS